MCRDTVNAGEGVDYDVKSELDVLDVNLVVDPELKWMGCVMGRNGNKKENALKSHNLSVSSVD